jgi:hypothetical protein
MMRGKDIIADKRLDLSRRLWVAELSGGTRLAAVGLERLPAFWQAPRVERLECERSPAENPREPRDAVQNC